jgi:hypothetical protein
LLAPRDPRLRSASAERSRSAAAKTPSRCSARLACSARCSAAAVFDARELARGRAEPQPERVERALAVHAPLAGVSERDVEAPPLLGQRRQLGEQVGALLRAALARLADRLHPLAGALQVLLVVRDRQRGGVVAVAQVLELVAGPGERELRLAALARRSPPTASSWTSWSRSRTSFARQQPPSPAPPRRRRRRSSRLAGANVAGTAPAVDRSTRAGSTRLPRRARASG